MGKRPVDAVKTLVRAITSLDCSASQAVVDNAATQQQVEEVEELEEFAPIEHLEKLGVNRGVLFFEARRSILWTVICCILDSTEPYRVYCATTNLTLEHRC